MACQHKAAIDVIKYLDSYYPRAIFAKMSNDGWLPLHVACKNNAPPEVLNHLVQAYPQSIRVPDRHAKLPWHLVCLKETSMEVVQFLAMRYLSESRAVATVSQKNPPGKRRKKAAFYTQTLHQ